MSFENNVFINCPFDKKFKKFLDPLLFTVIYCDFTPQISETKDSGSNRLMNILALIRNSKYSIHDLSRMVSKAAGDIARFNMPFELGIDLGFRNSGPEVFAGKKCLILDTESYRYQKAISDISGNDIKNYKSVQGLIRIVSFWLNAQRKAGKPGPKLIWEEYNEFKVHLHNALLNTGFSQKDIRALPKSQFIALAQEWVVARKVK
jgi:hypothetical protein